VGENSELTAAQIQALEIKKDCVLSAGESVIVKLVGEKVKIHGLNSDHPDSSPLGAITVTEKAERSAELKAENVTVNGRKKIVNGERIYNTRANITSDRKHSR
jgi:hypothetical protein